jgi:hypothetical protein
MTEEIQLNVSDNLGISSPDQDLLAKLTDTENTFIERKTVSDSKGWLKTAVAFANSCPIGYPAFLFVGVNDNGTVQVHANPPDFERLQKEVSARISTAWPPIYHLPRALRKDGLEFLVVIVPGSALRPHFSGPAYVRVGPETREASEEQYDELIAQRSSKFRSLQKLIGKTVLWQTLSPAAGNGVAVVEACNQHWLTVGKGLERRCFSIEWITISFDPHSGYYHLIVRG